MVESEPAEPLELKGQTEAVAAHRLVAATGEMMRRYDAAMVGRERELGLTSSFGLYRWVCLPPRCPADPW
jgi:hypothetical protein